MIVFSRSRDILDSDAKRLAAQDGNILLRAYPGMMHVWPIAPIPEGKRALDEAAEFIRRQTAYA
jgi:acetyl esterase/lipase